jgi:hypothetical protein
LALAACGGGEAKGPAKAVETLYAPYLQPDASKKPSNWDKSPVLSKKFKTVVDKGVGYGVLLNEPVLDFDPITWSQDGEVSNLKVTTTEETDDSAKVTATFDLSGEKREVQYDLTNNEGAWQVTSIRSGGEDLATIIDNNIKPAGDPAAMKAPIEEIYKKYEAAAGKPVPPLHTYAALHSSLKPLLVKAAAQNKRLGRDVFGFDPVVDGSVEPIKGTYYEPASSAVIVRFTKGSGVFAVVYDLAQEDGAWKIFNIRSASSYEENWDVRQQLEKDGIK